MDINEVILIGGKNITTLLYLHGERLKSVGVQMKLDILVDKSS